MHGILALSLDSYGVFSPFSFSSSTYLLIALNYKSQFRHPGQKETQQYVFFLHNNQTKFSILINFGAPNNACTAL